MILPVQEFGLTQQVLFGKTKFWAKDSASQHSESNFMKCPACHYNDTKVLDSRVINDGFSIRRRRECAKCSFRFSTYEELEILDLTVIKRDGSRQAYQREKIINGLKKALEKRPITEQNFRKLVSSIEREIQKVRKGELTANQIGQIIMKHLRKIDKVAYIRFASVYQSFEDISDFSDEVNKLAGRRSKK